MKHLLSNEGDGQQDSVARTMKEKCTVREWDRGAQGKGDVLGTARKSSTEERKPA